MQGRPRHRSTLADHPDVSLVLPIFVGGLPEQVRKLRENWKVGDLAGVRAVAHQLKGSGQSYGFAEITGRAARLEEAILAGTPPETLDPLVGALVSYLQEVEGYDEGA